MLSCLNVGRPLEDHEGAKSTWVLACLGTRDYAFDDQSAEAIPEQEQVVLMPDYSRKTACCLHTFGINFHSGDGDVRGFSECTRDLGADRLLLKVAATLGTCGWIKDDVGRLIGT